jgi:hypothetical protein
MLRARLVQLAQQVLMAQQEQQVLLVLQEQLVQQAQLALQVLALTFLVHIIR